MPRLLNVSAATACRSRLHAIAFPRDSERGGWWSIVGTFSPKVMKSGGIHRALEVAANTRAAGIGVYGVCMFETWLAHAADPT